MKYEIGGKIWFSEEKKSYKIRACDDRYLICTKPFNITHEVMYTIVDLKEDIRGADNYWKWGGYVDYKDDAECQKCLKELYEGEVEISKRNYVKLNIIRYEK